MDDLQKRIAELEARACEQDLLALLATDPKVQMSKAETARHLRLEALGLTTGTSVHLK